MKLMYELFKWKIYNHNRFDINNECVRINERARLYLHLYFLFCWRLIFHPIISSYLCRKTKVIINYLLSNVCASSKSRTMTIINNHVTIKCNRRAMQREWARNNVFVMMLLSLFQIERVYICSNWFGWWWLFSLDFQFGTQYHR